MKYYILITLTFSFLNNSAQGIDFSEALNTLSIAKSKIEDGWDGSYYLYKSLGYLANAFENHESENEIFKVVAEINLLGAKQSKSWIVIDHRNLMSFSTRQQGELKIKLDSLHRSILKLENENRFNKDLISTYGIYAEYMSLYIKEGKPVMEFINQVKYKQGEVMIKNGLTDEGCKQLYESSIIDYNDSQYISHECKDYEKRKELIDSINRRKKLTLEVKQWRSEHPGKIKFRTLLDKDFETIESYLGKPKVRNYKFDIGAGLNGNQFIGNKYVNADGAYLISFQNGHASFIKYYPVKYIQFDVKRFDSEETFNLDLESNLTKYICTRSKNLGNIGKIDLYTIDYVCSGPDRNPSINFYGENGKLILVTAY